MTRATGSTFQKRTIDPGRVMAMLQQMELAYQNGAWVAILGGAALCLGMVLAAAIAYALASFMYTGGPSLKLVFCVLFVLMIPALFFVAHGAQRPLPGPATPASQQIRTRRDDDDDTDDNDEVRIMAERAKALGERLNLGPRLVLWGIGRIRARSAFGTVPIERVAAAVALLTDAGSAVSPVKLLAPGESADQLEPLLGALLYHDLADISKRADRVWVTTDVKRRLGIPV